MFTRDEARACFANSNLTYGDIRKGDLFMLEMMLNAAFAEANISMGSYWYWKRVNDAKYYKGSFNPDGSIVYAFITAKGAYFDAWEVISFKPGGYISFCGEADWRNLQPVVDAFMRWCEWMVIDRARAAAKYQGYADQAGLAPAT